MERLFSPNLFLEDLSFEVHLGCLEEERKTKQLVSVDLWIFFARPPLACHSDELKDTVCYAKCVEVIRSTIEQKHYHLIEHLAYEIYANLKKQLPMNLEIGVRIHKLNPPVKELKQGVYFTYFPVKENGEKKYDRSRDWE